MLWSDVAAGCMQSVTENLPGKQLPDIRVVARVS